MGSMALDGIGGFPTRNIVDQLMQLDIRASKKPIVDKQATLKGQVSALQALNAKMSSITTNAWGVLGKKDSIDAGDQARVWQAATGKSSNKTVEIAANDGAEVGSLDFNVDEVATTKQATISGEVLTTMGDRIMRSTPPAMSIQIGGKITTIRPASGSAIDMAKAINSARDAGVSATAVRVGDGQYVLQITGKETGATDGDFKVYAGDLNADLQGKLEVKSTKSETGAIPSTTNTYDKEALAQALGTLQHGSATEVALSVNRNSTDAKITLWAGTAAEKSFTQATNTFKDIMPHVDITIGKQVTGQDGKLEPVKVEGVHVDVAADSSKAASAIKSMIGSMNLVVDEIASQTRPVEKTREDGSKYQAPGVLGSSSAASQISNGLRDLMAGGIRLDGELHSMSEFGIKLAGGKGDDLKLTFDSAAFNKAMAADPKRTQQAITAFADKVAKFANSYSDSDKGVLSLEVKSQQSYQKQVDQQLIDVNAALMRRQKTLDLQFARLQTMLHKNQQQGAWLAGQLANLPRMGGQ